MKSISFHIFNAVWFLFSLLPFWLLYILSDLLFYPLYYVVRYRRRVVRKNLVSSFPEKSPAEIVKIEKEFYSFFCDYVVETLKLFSISKENMKRRMTFSGIEEMEKAMGNDRSCILYLGHYCNWEWVSSLPLHFKDGLFCGQIYHPLNSVAFDRLFLKLRSRFQAESIPMKDTLRRVVRVRREGKRMVIGFISDQSPYWEGIGTWVDFLNQDTPTFTGAERIAKQLGAVVYYLDITRVKRGYYHGEFKQLAVVPADYPDYKITEMYMRTLEETIKRAPQYWLWTHKRWKKTREVYNKKFNVKPDAPAM